MIKKLLVIVMLLPFSIVGGGGRKRMDQQVQKQSIKNINYNDLKDLFEYYITAQFEFGSYTSEINSLEKEIKDKLNKGVEKDIFDIKDDDGQTLLHCAASEGFDKIVALFLNNGANVNVENSEGAIPLRNAILGLSDSEDVLEDQDEEYWEKGKTKDEVYRRYKRTISFLVGPEESDLDKTDKGEFNVIDYAKRLSVNKEDIMKLLNPSALENGWVLVTEELKQQ